MEEEGKHYFDVMLDLLFMIDLKTEFFGEGFEFNVDYMVGVFIELFYIVLGVFDGGAYIKFFNGGVWLMDLLIWMVRDIGCFMLEEVYYCMLVFVAHVGGFKDWGVLREGAAVDVVVYDFEELVIDLFWIGELVYDLLGGEWCWV